MSKARWLDETEAAAWRGLWAMSHLVFDRLGRELQRHSGLSIAEYDILVRLDTAEDGRIRMSALAEQTLAPRARLSYQIKGMQAAGLVDREECTTDRRGAFAVLTAAGREALRDTAPAHVQDVHTYLIEALTREQLEQLGTIADAVEAHLDAFDQEHA